MEQSAFPVEHHLQENSVWKHKGRALDQSVTTMIDYVRRARMTCDNAKLPQDPRIIKAYVEIVNHDFLRHNPYNTKALCGFSEGEHMRFDYVEPGDTMYGVCAYIEALFIDMANALRREFKTEDVDIDLLVTLLHEAIPDYAGWFYVTIDEMVESADEIIAGGYHWPTKVDQALIKKGE